MHKIYKVLFITFFQLAIIENCGAQNFLNGSFEINTCGGVDQINLINSQFDAMMSNTYAFGTWGGGGPGGGDMDIITSGSWGGSPGGECGLWYVALTGGGSDMFAMQLSAPLIAGNTYTMSYWDRLDGSYSSSPTEVALSTTNNTYGTVIYTAPVPPTANTWVQRTFTFVAPNNGMYVCVQQTGAFSGGTWCHVDNFVLGNSNNPITAGAVVGSPFCACSAFNVPFTSTGVFNAGNIYTAQLSDSTGSFANPTVIGTLASTANAGTIACTIPCNAVAGSLYQIQVVSTNPVNSVACGGINTVNITISVAPTVTVNSTTICPGQTANLVAGGATSYTWSAGATSTGVNTADASPITTTTYTVTGTTAGCSNTAVATVTIGGALNLAVNSPTICPGQTANLTATGATTYSWSAGATSTGLNTADANPVTTTTYTVTGTSGGCTGTAVATVTVVNSLTITVNSLTICPGQTANLIAGGANAYTWSAGATSTGVNTADASPLVTTTYTVTGTSGACSATAVATVTISNNLAISVTSDTICQGQTGTLTASGGTTYTWSSGFAGNPLTVTLNATTSYTVTGVQNGCSGQATGTVYVNPPAVVTVNTDTVCPGQATTLTASGCTGYLWSTGATTSTIVVSPPTTTTYTVTGNPTGCPGTATTTVQVQNVFPSIFVNSDSICNGSSAVLTAFGAGNYLWSTGAITSSITVSPTSTTSYTVSTTNQCNNSATATSLVAVKPKPIASFSTPDTVGCVPLCVTFSEASSVSSGNIALWNWSFGDGQTDVVQNPALHCYTNSGSFNVSLMVTASDGCRDTMVRNNYIHVYPFPTADFFSDPTETNLANATINFYNQSTGQTSWQWTFGDTSSSTVWSPSHNYTHPGIYPVTLIVSNHNGCWDTIVHTIIINDNFEFYAPNCITPNEDDVNEIFMPVGTGWDLDTYQLWIFDRWGNMCFYTKDPKKGWDGRANGGSETSATDVFVYRVEVKELGGDLHRYIGKVTVLK